MLDRNFTKQELYLTKSKTALQFADLQTGPENLFYEKYPRLMNMIFVSMFYGFGIPIFFVLTLVAFIISYIVEKYAVVRFYKKPPMYDDTLNINTAYFLKWGAFFYIAIGFWNLTNV